MQIYKKRETLILLKKQGKKRWLLNFQSNKKSGLFSIT